jgi:putative tricarboxylic transport membrane protein
MSEGTGSAAQASRSHIASSEHYWAGILLIALALAGPVLGVLLFGKGSLLDQLRAGWYSLPLALFGLVALTIRVRSPQDYYGGVALAALALFALWACNDLPGMRGFAFGPGTAPRLFAYFMLGLGVVVALIGLLTDGPPSEPFSFSGPVGGAVLLVVLIPMTYYAARIGKSLPGGIAPDIVLAVLEVLVLIALALVVTRYAPRGPVFITGATLIFAVTIRPLGLVLASFVSLVVSATATNEVRWVETMLWAIVLTAFCSVLFPYGLNLPLQLWPRF